MEKVINKEKCTGCTACMNICPKGAIKMIEETDGFKYPIIDETKCINCGLCKKTCPVLNTKENISINECYVGYSLDDEVKKKTSSGGIFPLFAEYVFDNNGIVIGAAFDNDNKLKHIAVKKNDSFDKLMGSKYLQSDLNNIFKYVKDNIKNNFILFVGTPCQVAGLKSFIKKDFNNLICIDLICHGVPSPKLFQKYIDELQNENGKLINYNFRDKSTGWTTYSNTAKFNDKSISQVNYQNNYMKLFLSDVALRESCFDCNFKLGNKYSDITLGDFWGVNNFYPEMFDQKGVSAIILNTEKGVEVFNYINDKVMCKKCNLDEIVQGNLSLKSSCEYIDKRNSFFNDLDCMCIDDLTKKYTKKKIYARIINKLKSVIKKFIK